MMEKRKKSLKQPDAGCPILCPWLYTTSINQWCTSLIQKKGTDMLFGTTASISIRVDSTDLNIVSSERTIRSSDGFTRRTNGKSVGSRNPKSSASRSKKVGLNTANGIKPLKMWKNVPCSDDDIICINFIFLSCIRIKAGCNPRKSFRDVEIKKKMIQVNYHYDIPVILWSILRWNETFLFFS